MIYFDSIKKICGLLGIIILLPIGVKAQLVHHWGATTNGLQLGINSGDPLCMLFIRNVSTNQRSIYIHRAPPEIRFEMKLLDPQGKPVDVISEKLLSLDSTFRNGGTVITNEIDFAASFSVTDIFKIKTNGLHTLIVSERFTTNIVRPNPDFPFSLIYPPPKPPAYFLFPPVTNTFNISPELVKK